MLRSGYGFEWLLKEQIKGGCLVEAVAIFRQFGRSFKPRLRRQVNLFIWISTRIQMREPVAKVPLGVDQVQEEGHQRGQ
jgi:hypothetical protein